MQKAKRSFVFVLTIAMLLLSACGGTLAATPGAAGPKVDALQVAFVGVVDSMAGDQWVINGQTVTVDPAVVRDGPFGAGDAVKVEGVIQADGSFVVSRVEVPTPQDLSTLPTFGSDNSNDSASDDNTNSANSNDANINDDNGNDVNSNEANSNEVNSNDANLNDDNSNDSNSNDDSLNSNDDNSNDANTNDDSGGADNSNDSDTNDDNSNAGGEDNGNDNGGEDNNNSDSGNGG